MYLTTCHGEAMPGGHKRYLCIPSIEKWCPFSNLLTVSLCVICSVQKMVQRASVLVWMCCRLLLLHVALILISFVARTVLPRIALLAVGSASVDIICFRFVCFKVTTLGRSALAVKSKTRVICEICILIISPLGHKPISAPKTPYKEE